MEIYILQIIATVIAILLLALSKFVSNKLILKYGLLIQKSEIRMKQIRQIISVLLNIIFIFIVAIIWGLQPKNLFFGLSSIFAVIGVAMFAQWSMLSNITAGVIMFFTAPYRVGDRIHIIDKEIPLEATIESIQAFYTHVRTDEDELVVLPNNLFFQKIVCIKKEKEITEEAKSPRD